MTRLTTVAAAIALSALAGAAHAQSQAEIAAKLNEEGKALMFANKYGEATAKFRAAVARVPEPGYFINLCTSLFHEGKFGEAITACNAVANSNPSGEQRGKADKLVLKIKDEAKAQGISSEALGGGQSPGDPTLNCAETPNDSRCEQPPPPDVCKSKPNAPECGTNAPPQHDPGQQPPPTQPYAVGRPPTGTGLFMSTTPDNKYTWTLGIELFGGGGSIGQPDAYGTAAGGFRLKGDYMLNPRTRFGAQGYLQYTHFGQGEMDSFDVSTLDIIDLGVAAYKHLCPHSAQRLCLTPLAGIQLAMMSPAGEQNAFGEQIFNYAAVGARLELGAHFAFGTRMEHVLGVTLGVNVYSRVVSGSEDSFDDMLTPEQVGLDKGGAAAYLGLGYTYRFRTPLGSAPFITLE